MTEQMIGSASTGNQPLFYRACREFCKIKCEKFGGYEKKVVLLRCSTIIRGFPKPDIPLGKPSDKRHRRIYGIRPVCLL